MDIYDQLENIKKYIEINIMADDACIVCFLFHIRFTFCKHS